MDTTTKYSEEDIESFVLAAENSKIDEVLSYLSRFGGSIIEEKDKGGCPALVAASCAEDCDMVSTLLRAGANIEATNSDGATALTVAGHSGRLELVSLLLDAGANINANDNDGWTALTTAAMEGHHEVVSTLLRANANIEAGQDGWTPLRWASEFGHQKVVSVLLGAGASIGTKDKESGDTPLHAAAREGRHEVVSILLGAGANLEAKNHNGLTALMLACSFGHLESVSILLSAGANTEVVDTMEESGATALMFASKNGHVEVVSRLLRAGVTLEAKRYNGGTALMLACGEGHPEVASILLAAGANIEEQDYNQSTALIWTCAEPVSVRRVKINTDGSTVPLVDEDINDDVDDEHHQHRDLSMPPPSRYTNQKPTSTIDHDINDDVDDEDINDNVDDDDDDDDDINDNVDYDEDIIDDVDDDDVDIFVGELQPCEPDYNHPAELGRLEVLSLLLDAGANIEAQDDDGFTALIWASSNGRARMVTMLLAAGANIEAKDANEMSALSKACETDGLEVVPLLLAAGANIEAKDDDGETPLMKAIANGNYGTVSRLLASHADVFATNNVGSTVIAEAASDKFGRTGVQVMSILLQHVLASIADFQTREDHSVQLASDICMVLCEWDDVLIFELACEVLALSLTNNWSSSRRILSCFDIIRPYGRNPTPKYKLQVLFYVLREYANTRLIVGVVCDHFVDQFHGGRVGGNIGAVMNQSVVEVLGDVDGIGHLLGRLEKCMRGVKTTVIARILKGTGGSQMLTQLKEALEGNRAAQLFVEDRLQPLLEVLV